MKKIRLRSIISKWKYIFLLSAKEETKNSNSNDNCSDEGI